MFERIKKILIVLLWFVQFALCLAIKYLEKLSRVKAGVNHHLYFKKEEYMQMFFTDEKIRIMFICAMILLAIALLLMMVAKNKKIFGWDLELLTNVCGHLYLYMT